MSQMMMVPQAVPTLPIAAMSPEMVELSNNMFADMSAGFTSSVRRIKIRKTDFLLTEGQTETQLPHLSVVVLGMSPCNYAVWYAREFAPGQEAGPPDLVWLRPTEDTFPPALPKEFHKKIVRNGREMWAFQTRRRVVVALVSFDNEGNVVSIDTDNPCVMDFSGMSLYGKSNPRGNYYKWNGLLDLCKKYSQGNMFVSPAHFPTQIVIDPEATVTGVAMFRPLIDQNGYLRFLSAQHIQQVLGSAQSAVVKDLLNVREVLTYDPNKNAQQPAAQPAAQPVYQQPAAQPMYQQPVAQPATQQPVAQPVQQPAAQVIGTVPPVQQQASNVMSQPAQPAPQAAPNPVGVNAEATSLLQQASQVLEQPAHAQPASVSADPVQDAISALNKELNG